jgi:outer membrane protein
VKSLPKSIDAVTDLAMERHPAILVAQYNVDMAAFNVSVLEGGLLPSVSVSGKYARSGPAQTSDGLLVGGTISVPIYDGGAISSQVRQAKETLGNYRIQVDLTRDSIRAEAVTAYGLLSAARASIAAAEAGVRAASLAVEGIVEERKVGQATTLDVLTAQQTLLNARVSLVQAQYSVVVGSYRVLAAIGGLSAADLGLNVATYEPAEHYRAVRDKWFGLRTPDGR